MSRDSDAHAALENLAGCTTPLLIGVRHHSVALARVMPMLLDQFQPKAILLELPPDFQQWLAYLGRDELEAPVALAACGETHLLSFYPLADFSPELAAVRWAAKHSVPVIPCDLDLVSMQMLEMPGADGSNEDIDDDAEDPEARASRSQDTLVNALLEKTGSRDTGDLWERLVETPATESTPEMIRRAGLLFGWAVRHSSAGPSPRDAQREYAMREAIAAAPEHSAAVIGAFHAAALLPEPILWTQPKPIDKPKELPELPTTSLVSYSFAQLDQRSGYPAGVMDPVWQQTMLAADEPDQVNRLVADLAVKLCRQLRGEGHVAGTPDAFEIVRLAVDLGRLRGFAAAGRGELLEAIETSLVQGDLLGRGRAVAAAAQKVLVGNQRGNLPHDTPRSGLAPQIEATLQRLRLPTRDDIGEDAKDYRLDPLRSKLDRARAVTLRRLNLIGVHYAQRFDTESVGGRDNLTEAWRIQWTHATTATIEAAGIRGVTLTQASEAAIARIRHADTTDGETTHPTTLLMRLAAAAECGLPGATRDILLRISATFTESASAAQLVQAGSWMQRIAAGHVAGLPICEEDAAGPDVETFRHADDLDPVPLIEAALGQLDGLRGSDQTADVITVLELASMIRAGDQDSTDKLGGLLPRLRSWLVRTRHNGSSLMQGAAWGTLAMLATVNLQKLSRTQSGWYDGASDSNGRKQLRQRFAGMILPLLPLVSADPDWLSGLETRLADSPDDHFLSRLPSLRAGFQPLTPNDRARLLRDRLQLIQPHTTATLRRQAIEDPELLASATAADRAARASVAELLPELKLRDVTQTDASAAATAITEPPGEIPLADRWRLVLGVQGSNSPQARRVAFTLDQLYGTSTCEGTGGRSDLVAPGQGGGSERAQPSARQWVDDVGDLFGKDVCEEVLGEAAAGGRAAILKYLNPDQVRPSIDLLEQVLSLRGALPESELTVLRKLARRITDKLAKQLANRLRPALTGLSTPRPTRRRSRKLDLDRTLRENLRTAHTRSDGSIGLAPERMVFRSPARRQMDWHLIFVVDVSGSMEPSVIYSALMAAIFSALPAIDVRFFAFSTEVIDFSERVDDPLSLLLEVQVGGGTHIGLGLRAAREAVRNPARTIVVVVSDFEEGVSLSELLWEVRALADSGVKLLGLAALDDQAKPRYHAGNAAAVASAGMSVAAVSPERLATWVGDQIRGGNR